MGLMDWLSPLLTEGTNLVATAKSADAQADKDALTRTIQGLTLKHRLASEDLTDNLRRAQIDEATARTKALGSKIDAPAARAEKIRAVNDGLPPEKQLSEDQIGLISGNETLYSRWAQKNLGLSTDPLQLYEQKRDYAVKNPLPSRARSDAGVKQRAGLSAVTGQVRETRDDLNRARRATKPLSILASPTDSANYNSAAATIPGLQHRLDSLSTVRDQLAGDLQTPHSAPSASPPSETDQLMNTINSIKSPVRPLGRPAPVITRPPEAKLSIQSQDEYDHLRSIGMSDAAIVGRYIVPKNIRRNP